MVVDPNTARIQLSSYPRGLFQVLRPDRSTEAHLGIVGTDNYFVFIAPRSERYNGSKWFFRHDPRILCWPVDNSWSDKVARFLVVCSPKCDIPLLFLDVRVEGLDPFKLHGILNRAYKYSLLTTWSHFKGLRESNDCVFELIVNRFVNINALYSRTDLSRVKKGKRGDLYIVSLVRAFGLG